MRISFQSVDRLTDTQLRHSISLEPRAVHLWGIELDAPSQCFERCVAWLDETERTRATRFVREQDRQQYVLTHGGLRAILSRYLGVSPHEISLMHTETGKPFVTSDGGARSAITFNLSHARNRALIAVTTAQEVGVDLERVRAESDIAKLSERYFTPSEHAVIIRATEEQRAMIFCRHWVAKEALLKAQGIGLQGLSDCEVLLGQEPFNGETRVRLGPRFTEPLRLRLLSCGEGWEAAVAAQTLDFLKQGG